MNNLFITVARARDFPDLSMEYRQGHSDVLGHFGIRSITSFKDQWHLFDNSIIILAREEKAGKICAGLRIQFYSQNQELPVVQAVGTHFPSIRLTVSNMEQPLVEFCGLWNSIHVAGKKLGIVLTLVAIATAIKMNVKTCLIFNSKLTFWITKYLNFDQLNEFGNNGAIPYPDERFLSYIWKKNIDQSSLTLDSRDLAFVNELCTAKEGFAVEKHYSSNISVNFEFLV